VILYRSFGQVFPAVVSDSVVGQKQSQLGVQGMSCQSPVQTQTYIHTYIQHYKRYENKHSSCNQTPLSTK